MEKTIEFLLIYLEKIRLFLKDSYLELENNVTHTAGGQIRKRDGDHKRLINLGPIALRSEYTLTNSSASEKEKN